MNGLGNRMKLLGLLELSWSQSESHCFTRFCLQPHSVSWHAGVEQGEAAYEHYSEKHREAGEKVSFTGECEV